MKVREGGLLTLRVGTPALLWSWRKMCIRDSSASEWQCDPDALDSSDQLTGLTEGQSFPRRARRNCAFQARNRHALAPSAHHG